MMNNYMHKFAKFEYTFCEKHKKTEFDKKIIDISTLFVFLFMKEILENKNFYSLSCL